MKGVENVFTQHTTVLKDIMDSLLKGRLSEESYPTLGNEMNLSRSALTNFPTVDIINYFFTIGRVQDVVIFIVGGVTYEESLAVHQFCRSNNGVRIVLGGTMFHNSNSFLADVEMAVKGASNTKKNASSLSGRHIKLT